MRHEKTQLFRFEKTLRYGINPWVSLYKNKSFTFLNKVSFRMNKEVKERFGKFKNKITHEGGGVYW